MGEAKLFLWAIIGWQEVIASLKANERSDRERAGRCDSMLPLNGGVLAAWPAGCRKVRGEGYRPEAKTEPAQETLSRNAAPVLKTRRFGRLAPQYPSRVREYRKSQPTPTTMSSKEAKPEVDADEVTDAKKDSVKGTKRPAEVRF